MSFKKNLFVIIIIAPKFLCILEEPQYMRKLEEQIALFYFLMRMIKLYASPSVSHTLKNQ